MIEIISATNRPGSNTLKIAKIVAEKYEKLGVKSDILNLQDMPAEIFDPSSYGKKPASFAPFQERVLAAKGLHLIIPEYNGSFPGVFKYFIDMLKFPESLEHRRVAFLGHGAGIWGNLRGIEQAQMIFGYRNSYIYPERVWITQVNNKLADDGKSFKDADVDKRVDSQVSGFANFIVQF